MTLKRIIKVPNPFLSKKVLPVEKITDDIRKLLDDMLETMYHAKGIGLAAIQVGVPKRIIVMDIGNREKEKKPMYFVNPIIKNKNSECSTYEEGCLSVPNQFAEVDRPSTCEVEYLDYNGNKKILKATGLLSTCIQHEMDHLEGVLFIDYLSKLKKTMIIKKLSKQKNKSDRIVV